MRLVHDHGESGMSPSLRHWSPILILGKLPNSQYGKWLDLKRVIAHSQGRLQAKEEEEDSAQGSSGSPLKRWYWVPGVRSKQFCGQTEAENLLVRYRFPGFCRSSYEVILHKHGTWCDQILGVNEGLDLVHDSRSCVTIACTSRKNATRN